MIRYILLTITSLLFCFEGHGNHLTGGELTFQCNGNNNYQFFLSIYRDEPNLVAGNDDQESFIFIYNLDFPTANPTVHELRQTNVFGVAVLPNIINCTAINPPNIATNLKQYVSNTINLTPNGNGYRVVYQRCCRNTNIINLPLIDGSGQGLTYKVFITRSALLNCSGATTQPVLEFSDEPPVRFCLNTPSTIDQSVDNDILTLVDSVVYELCSPFQGASPDCAIINGTVNPNNPACPLFPFNDRFVTYNSGYNSTQPLGSRSTITIDRNTGELFVIPRDNQGLFVVNICATAYLDGLVYTNIARDLQYSIFDCGNNNAGVPEVMEGQDNVGGITNQDTSYILFCGGLDVPFTQNSPQALTYFWDFGIDGIDDDTSVISNPTYSFPDTGTYLVTFVINRGEPCVDTSYSIIKIFPRLEADFVIDQTAGACFTFPVSFQDNSLSTLTNNQIVSWEWDFGDGSPISTDQNPIYEYSNAGSFQVELTVETSLGCVDMHTITTVTEPSPSPDFDNLLTCTGLSHQFNNISNLNGTQLMSYSWDFGDGNGFSLTTTNPDPPVQVYTAAGDYDIQLAVNSANGCSDTITKVLTVIESVLAEFTYSPSPVCPGQEIQFTNTTSQAFDSLRWTIDGNNFSIDDPNYTYSIPGSYAISLVVYSSGICSDSTGQNILVENGPFADFNGDSTCVNSNFSFVNLSNDNGFPIDDYNWDFGDGGTSSDFEPNYEFSTPGDFEVTLIVNSSLVTCSDTTTRIVNVKEGIVTDFSFAPDTICEGITTINFTNESMGGSWDSIFWNFGNDSFSTDNNPNIIYETDSLYTVTLSIYDDICGELDISYPVPVLNVPALNLPDTLNICDGIFETLSTDGNTAYEILWSTGASTTDITIDNSLDTVTVIVDNNGCISFDTTIIKRDCPAYLPNSFTPNGDGVNDVFVPLDLNITSFTLKIYDRWGKMVFETNDFNNGWDGNYSSGHPAPIESYTYILDGIGLDEKVLFQHGTVSIIR